MEIRSTLFVLALGLAVGCAGAGKGGAATEGITGSNQKNIPKVDPELCDTSGKQVQTFDLNQDGTPDVWKLYATVEEDGTKVEVLTCKQVDYDHDGKKDYVATYNKRGELVAEEFDFTFDGRFDAREHYAKKGGKIYMVERDLDHNKAPDTWEKYDPDGNLESVERDRNGDGKPDLWEQYQRGVLLAILYDDDFDGKVDRKESGRPTSIASRPADGTTPHDPASAGAGASESSADSADAPADYGAREELIDETPTAPGRETPAANQSKPATGKQPAAKKRGGK